MPLQFAFVQWNCFLFWNWHPWATIVVNFFLIVDQILWRVKEASFQRKTCILCPWQLYCVALFYLQIGNCIWKLWVSCVLLITFFNFFFWLFFLYTKTHLKMKKPFKYTAPIFSTCCLVCTRKRAKYKLFVYGSR